jgi:hypothetical protein
LKAAQAPEERAKISQLEDVGAIVAFCGEDAVDWVMGSSAPSEEEMVAAAAAAAASTPSRGCSSADDWARGCVVLLCFLVRCRARAAPPAVVWEEEATAAAAEEEEVVVEVEIGIGEDGDVEAALLP